MEKESVVAEVSIRSPRDRQLKSMYAFMSLAGGKFEMFAYAMSWYVAALDE